MADPSRVVDALTAYWRSATLVAAIDLGVFRALSTRARAARSIAHACGSHVDTTRRLCDALVAEGWLNVGPRGYRLTAESAAWLGASAATSIVGARDFFNGPPVSTGFASLASTVRRGRAPKRRVDWAKFAGAAWSLRRHVARAVAGELAKRGLGGGRILDVGAGASPLGVLLLERHATARLTAIDDGSTLRVARGKARAAGVSARLTTAAGDARAIAWPAADLVLMVNVLDYFSESDQLRLLVKARRAVAAGGALVIAAPLLAASRQAPASAVAYDLMLMAIGGGRASTINEMRRRVRQAGFSRAIWIDDADVMLASVPRAKVPSSRRR